MSLQSTHNNLIIIKEYIINELNAYIKTLKLEVKCMAIKADGKKCTNKAVGDLKVCKKHEKCKNLKLVKKEKTFHVFCIIIIYQMKKAQIVRDVF